MQKSGKDCAAGMPKGYLAHVPAQAMDAYKAGGGHMSMTHAHPRCQVALVIRNRKVARIKNEQ